MARPTCAAKQPITLPMSRLTVTATIAWVIVSLLLWFMIRLDSNILPWRQIGAVEQGPAPVAETPQSPLPNPPALSCEEAEGVVSNRVESAKQCDSDSDCTLFDFGYPMTCMTSVAKSEMTALRLAYRRYEESCDFRVYYDCPDEPMQRRAVCRENRCAVSLQSTDDLETETREYLGQGDSGQ
jgi:hypothetical protein